jgi:hypothetical protein
MNRYIIDILDYTELFLCVVVLVAMVYRKQLSNYRYLAALLTSHICTGLILIPLLFMKGKPITDHVFYRIYLYTFWTDNLIETILGLVIIYSIFRMALAPLKGLQSLGTIVFRWVGCISLMVTPIAALRLHHTFSPQFIFNFMMELRRMQSVLTLCLLLFVCFAIIPLGLSYRSRMFGVLLGLGIQANAYLVLSVWQTYGKDGIYTPVNIVCGVLTCFAYAVWTAYFALPEPKRRIITLPTTSPFLRWNQISQVLGDKPGFVAVGGIPPELFAPAEIEIMRRASLQMKDNPLLHEEQPA